MEALICRSLGDPTVAPDGEKGSALTISESYPVPDLASPTAVRIRVRSTSLNFANLLQIHGKYQEKIPLPFIPGSDYSGTVESVGSGVTKFKAGDSVCSFAAAGSFAQFIVADESELFPVPEGCDLVAAGAVPIAYGTSHLALVHRAKLSANQVSFFFRRLRLLSSSDDNLTNHTFRLPIQTLLVLGAAGGVGVAAVQIGKLLGANVIAIARYTTDPTRPFRQYLKISSVVVDVTKRGEEKAQYLRSLGADHVVDSGNEDMTESIKGFLKGRNLRGVDVLYDPVGGKLNKESLKLMNWGAQILIIGFASGEIPVIPANIALVK
ncbi:hypothetical protein M569_14343, partial [Genlisea aurea]